MLKLEKIAKGRDYNIILRAKPTLFSARFIFALGYALLLHASALLLFRIPPFTLPESTTKGIPIFVSIDESQLNLIQSLAIVFDEKENLASYLEIPPEPLPTYISLKPMPMRDAHPWEQHLYALHTPFFSMENSIAIQQESTLFAALESFAPVTINLYGALSEKTLLYHDCQEESLWALLKVKPELSYSAPCHFTYKALIDRERGELCWWEILNSEGDKAFESLALDLIKSLQFAKEPGLFLEDVEVEIVISPSYCFYKEV